MAVIAVAVAVIATALVATVAAGSSARGHRAKAQDSLSALVYLSPEAAQMVQRAAFL